LGVPESSKYPVGDNLTKLTDISGAGEGQISIENQANAWSPDGSRILFKASFADSVTYRVQVRVINKDGANLTELTSGDPQDKPLAWSPDGGRILFERFPDIYIMNPDGTGQAPLVRSAEVGASLVSGATWSTDGSRIAYVRRIEVGQSLPKDTIDELWVVDADGANQTQLTSAAYIDFLAWRPTPTAPTGKPSVAPGGVVSASGTPLVRPIAPGSIFSLYGSEFAPVGTSVVQPELDDNGRVSSILNGACVEIDEWRAPLFAVLPGQINLQALPQLSPGTANAVVIRDCDTADEKRSAPVSFPVAAAQPAFFNFVNNPDGVNPIAALHGGGPDPIGPPGLFSTVVTTPASPGEFISLYATGLGATSPSFEAGEIPGAAASVLGMVEVSVGGIELTPGDISYAGVAPCCAGLYQVVIRAPDNAPDGNLPIFISIDGVASPEGPFLAVEQ